MALPNKEDLLTPIELIDLSSSDEDDDGIKVLYVKTVADVSWRSGTGINILIPRRSPSPHENLSSESSQNQIKTETLSEIKDEVGECTEHEDLEPAKSSELPVESPMALNTNALHLTPTLKIEKESNKTDGSQNQQFNVYHTETAEQEVCMRDRVQTKSLTSDLNAKKNDMEMEQQAAESQLSEKTVPANSNHEDPSRDTSLVMDVDENISVEELHERSSSLVLEPPVEQKQDQVITANSPIGESADSNPVIHINKTIQSHIPGSGERPKEKRGRPRKDSNDGWAHRKALYMQSYTKNKRPPYEERQRLADMTGVPESTVYQWFSRRRFLDGVTQRKRQTRYGNENKLKIISEKWKANLDPSRKRAEQSNNNRTRTTQMPGISRRRSLRSKETINRSPIKSGRHCSKFTLEQREILKSSFRLSKYPEQSEKLRLVKKTNLQYKQVKTWFTQQRVNLRKQSSSGTMELERDPEMPVLEPMVDLVEFENETTMSEMSESTFEESESKESESDDEDFIMEYSRKRKKGKVRPVASKKSYIRLPEEKERVLLDFFENKSRVPVPIEIEQLSEEIDLNSSKISQWFRQKAKETEELESQNDSEDKSVSDNISVDDIPLQTRMEAVTTPRNIFPAVDADDISVDESLPVKQATPRTLPDNSSVDVDLEDEVKIHLDAIAEISVDELREIWPQFHPCFYKLMELHTEEATTMNYLWGDSDKLSELFDCYNLPFNEEQQDEIVDLNYTFMQDNKGGLKGDLDDFSDDSDSEQSTAEVENFMNNILNPWAKLFLYTIVAKVSVSTAVYDLAKGEEGFLQKKWVIPSIMDAVIDQEANID